MVGVMITVCMLPRTVVTTAEGVGVHAGCEVCCGGDEVTGDGDGEEDDLGDTGAGEFVVEL